MLDTPYITQPHIKFCCYICGNETNCIGTLSLRTLKFTTKPIQNDPSNVNIFVCTVCDHTMLEDCLSDDHYADFDLTNFFTCNYAMKDRIRQVKYLLENSENKSLLLEIGSGEGEFLELASTYFHNVIGFEPSSILADRLKIKNLPHINDYFSKEMMKTQRCDVFYSAHVFEHLTNPTDVLKDIYDVCNDDAIGIIEVPDGSDIQKQRKICHISPEHVSYYSPASLAFLAHLAHFQILHIVKTEYSCLEIALKKVKKGKKIEEQVMYIEKKLEEIRTHYSHISAWGAGNKMGFLLPMLEKIGLKNLFDNDPAKIGKYISGCKTKISKPNKEEIVACDVILLFGTQFDNEMVKDLREKYDFTGDIVTIDC